MKTSARFQRFGFSLIELLVVCSIIGIIVGFTIGPANTMMRGSQLTQGSQLLSDQIGLARQLALTRNHSMEVRFYKYADPETPGEDPKQPTTWKYRAFQILEVLENGAAIPINKIQILPTTVVMNAGRLSTLLDDTVRGEATKPQQNDPEIPRLSSKQVNKQESYVYHSLRFNEDGSTDLSSSGDSGWYVTLHGVNDVVPEESNKPPPNFFTIQVDPITGSTRSFRPTAG